MQTYHYKHVLVVDGSDLLLAEQIIDKMPAHPLRWLFSLEVTDDTLSAVWNFKTPSRIDIKYKIRPWLDELAPGRDLQLNKQNPAILPATLKSIFDEIDARRSNERSLKEQIMGFKREDLNKLADYRFLDLEDEILDVRYDPPADSSRPITKGVLWFQSVLVGVELTPEDGTKFLEQWANREA